MDNKAIGLTEENWRTLIDLCKERHGSTATTAVALNNLAVFLFENHMGAAPRQLECKMLIGEAAHMLEVREWMTERCALRPVSSSSSPLPPPFRTTDTAWATLAAARSLTRTSTTTCMRASTSMLSCERFQLAP